MSSYAFWNNKGGVGKSFLTFIASSEYAHRNPNADIYVIDLCPQANTSETLLGGQYDSKKAMDSLLRGSARKSIAGYIEERLNSPFAMISNVEKFVTRASDWNPKIPKNLHLICGDNLLEVLSEAIRQTSQLSIPINSWQQVTEWVKDLKTALRARSKTRETVFFIDCNPSFAVYTQLALAASDQIIVPYTADDSSRRAIENVAALLYGVGDDYVASFARLSFYKRAKEEGVEIPNLHLFINNRITLFDGKPSKAFNAASKAIKDTLQKLYTSHKSIFSSGTGGLSEKFIDVPDYHSACVVCALTGTPVHKLKAGPKTINSERIQINKAPLERYKEALENFISYL